VARASACRVETRLDAREDVISKTPGIETSLDAAG